MSRYIVEYEVLHGRDQVVRSEMKAYPTIFTDKNIDEAKQIVNILSQIHSDCNIVELEVSCENTEDDVYHHMFDALKENQEDCDRCVKNTNGIEWDNSNNHLQHLIDISVAPRCICACLKAPHGKYWSVLWLHEPKDPETLKTYYYYDDSGEEIPTGSIEKFIALD